MAEILVVDDEKDMLRACGSILSTLGHQPVVVSGGAQALEILASQEFDLVLCDLFMPEVDGMEVLRKMNDVAPRTPIVLFTAFGTVDRAVAAMKAGAFDFLEKPFTAQSLQLLLEKGLRQRRLVCERDNLRSQLADKFSFDNIIGRSHAMVKIFEMIERVAATEANVIVTGESGAGKELVAQSIHARSARECNAFIPVNCGALPENIFESELFGYERGAFTGAIRRKPGLLECAHGGTFFLDEVCELSEALQVKLLRVLQDRKVRRLGGDVLRDLDVRFIAATNREVEEAVRKGALREDFYYRLNVIRIHIPPLRERPDDIAPLAEHFLKHYSKSSPREKLSMSDETLRCLEDYAWPGNVRELRNAIERAVTLAKSDQITPSELPSQMPLPKHEVTHSVNIGLTEAKRRAVDKAELDYLVSSLRHYKGNVTRIAEDACMTRRNLHRLLRKHGLEADAWRKFEAVS